MSRFFLVSAMALTLGLVAGEGVCATVPPVPTMPTAPVDLSTEAALAAQAKDGSAKLDVSPVINEAQKLTNQVLGVTGVTGDASNAALGAATPLGDSAPISSADLGSTTGGANVTTNTNMNVLIGAVTDQTLSASNTNNTMSAGSIINGALNISPNAFNGFSGVGNFVMNTGNQNNVQGNLSVTIVLSPSK
jgi:hypothetical protein